MKLRVYRTFPGHLATVIAGWITLSILHIQLSGWGQTGYLSFLGKQADMKGLPIIGSWYNLYNFTPDACRAYWSLGNEWIRIGGCGYPLTNLMHGFAWVIIGLTIGLFLRDLALYAIAFWSYLICTVTGVVWEKWELISGTTVLRPELFSTVQQATTEGLRLLNDTVDDIQLGVIFLLITLALLLAADRHFGYEYIGA